MLQELGVSKNINQFLQTPFSKAQTTLSVFFNNSNLAYNIWLCSFTVPGISSSLTA